MTETTTGYLFLFLHIVYVLSLQSETMNAFSQRDIRWFNKFKFSSGDHELYCGEGIIQEQEGKKQGLTGETISKV